MSARELDLLIDTSTLLELPGRKTLFSEGQRPVFLHILMDGTVELFVRRGRRESSVTLLQKETPFILAAVVKDAPYLMSARSSGDWPGR